MIYFNSNDREYGPKNFSKDSLYYLSKEEISEQMKSVIINSDYEVKKFDIMDIKVGQEDRSVLLIELDILPKIDPEVYLDKLVDNFFIFTFGEDKDGISTDKSLGNITLPFLKSDLKSIEIICEMKSELSKLKHRVTTAEDEFYQVDFLKDIAVNLITDLNNFNTICMTSLDGIRIVNKQTTQDENIERMVEKGLNGSRLIDNLSKRYRKTFKPDHTEAPIYNDLKLIVEDARALVQRDLKLFNIDFSINTPKNLNILGYELDFIHCFTNIFKNSIEAIKKTKNPWIKIEAKETKTGLTVLIIDSGNGINKDIQNKIFEANFTTKENRTSVSGMGLYMTDKSLKKVGLELLYIEGKNTVFGIHFPSDSFKIKNFS